MITLYFRSGGRGVRGGFSHEEHSSYTAWQERMMNRPTV